MMETESISNKQRADSQPGRDRLSELPLEIIHKILALVPIRDAIRTSILSRRWRYTWTSLPHLVFEEDRSFSDYYKLVENIDDRMENFITHVLFLHKGPVHKVQMSVPFQRNCLSIGPWLLCLSRKDLRELIIDTGCFTWVQRLHSSIYSCKKLTKLELFNCQLDPPPTTFKAFLFLRCLSLRDVFLSTNEVESFVANCPLLEELTLLYCKLEELRITAPNLKVLLFMDGCSELSVYAPLLAELSVKLHTGFNCKYKQRNCSACNYTDFIGGFTNLEKLDGDGFFPMYLSMGIESCHHTLVFHRLKDIRLALVDISVVARLILGAPNLEKLEFSHPPRSLKHRNASKERHVSFSHFEYSPDFKLEKLSFVKITRITSLPPHMELIRFLLERSPVLETMCLDVLSSTEKQKVSAELDECKRASPNVKLTVLDLVNTGREAW